MFQPFLPQSLLELAFVAVRGDHLGVVGSDLVAVFAGLVGECRSREEYEEARLRWLEQVIGFDASYFGAASPEQLVKPVVSGVSTTRVEQCEAHADRYWRD